MQDTKERLSLLWLFALLNYLYADVVGLFAIAGSRTVPHLGGIAGPRKAVRAAIVAEARRKQ
jgi:hypothetical protein